MRFYLLVLGILSVWRITYLLYGEDGPWDVFVRLRNLAGQGFWGKLLDCFYCLSVWIAAPFAFLLGEDWHERLLLVPALSAGAIMVERLTSHERRIPMAHYTEDQDVNDVVLRREEKPISSRPDEPTDH
jgi:hypothetical protein